MGKPVESYTVSASSFQYFDKSNFTLAGIEQKFSKDKGYVSAFLGAATDFNKDGMAVIDLKGGYKYDSKGIFSQNLRIRNKIGKETESTQIRYSPLTIDVPVGKNTSLYMNPHYSGTMNHKAHKWTNSAGVFAGATQKLNKNTSLSLEIQRYNLQDIKDNSGKNWSANAIISYKF